MRDYTINVENDTLVIKIRNKKRIEILIDNLSLSRKYRDFIDCYDYIIHLQETKKDLVSYSLLYDIAKLINSRFKHKINWINTFIAVNEIDYYNNLNKGEYNDDATDITQGIDSIFNKMKDRKKEINQPEIRTAIKESVIEKLK